jgi:hypothetical protein
MPEENPQENSNLPNSREIYEPEDFEQREIERLKREILDREKKIAEKRAERELTMEIFKPASEGAVDQEKIEIGSAPAAQINPAQIKKQSQQISALDPQNQVKALCNLAFQKGLDFAIQTARNLNNPYVLDAFHDALVDELYRRLIEERKIEKI